MERRGIVIRRWTIVIASWTVLFGATVPAAVAAPNPVRPHPVDPNASPAVVELLSNLQNAADPELSAGLMFGQQHANWDSTRESLYTAGWSDWRAARVRLDELNTFPSDIELAASLFTETSANKPSVYGFNLQLALNVSPSHRRAYARQIVAAYSTGAVVTMHYPADNPAVGGDNGVVAGNPLCHLTNDWMNPPAASADTIATWMAELQDASAFIDEINDLWRDPDLDGVRERQGTVAMVFRPLHEMTGITHWWAGRFFRADPELCSYTAPQAYRTVWRKTVEYLIGEDDPSTDVIEGLDRHEFLFAWSPGRPTLTTEWRKYHPNFRLPGRWGLTDYVDVAGLDIYETSIGSFASQLRRDITALDEFVGRQANAKRDVLAITEFGARKGLAGRVDADWYTHGLLDTLVDTGVIDRIAYAMTWTNRTDDQFWVPVPCFNVEGCPDLAGFDQRFVSTGNPEIVDWGFSDFIASPLTTLQNDLPAWWMMPEARIEPYIPCPHEAERGPHLVVPCAR